MLAAEMSKALAAAAPVLALAAPPAAAALQEDAEINAWYSANGHGVRQPR